MSRYERMSLHELSFLSKAKQNQENDCFKVCKLILGYMPESEEDI